MHGKNTQKVHSIRQPANQQTNQLLAFPASKQLHAQQVKSQRTQQQFIRLGVCLPIHRIIIIIRPSVRRSICSVMPRPWF